MNEQISFAKVRFRGEGVFTDNPAYISRPGCVVSAKKKGSPITIGDIFEAADRMLVMMETNAPEVMLRYPNADAWAYDVRLQGIDFISVRDNELIVCETMKATNPE